MKNRKEIDYKALGDRVRQWRKTKNISQEELAAAVDKSVQHISNIERAHTRVSLSTLTDIANYLNVSLNDLMCDSLKNSGEAYTQEFSRLLKDCDEAKYKKYNKAFKSIIETFE